MSKEIMKQMEKDTRNIMDVAYNELRRIIKPINVTKLTYIEKKKFIDSNGFNEAWWQISKIVNAYQWLDANCRLNELEELAKQ